MTHVYKIINILMGKILGLLGLKVIECVCVCFESYRKFRSLFYWLSLCTKSLPFKSELFFFALTATAWSFFHNDVIETINRIYDV